MSRSVSSFLLCAVLVACNGRREAPPTERASPPAPVAVAKAPVHELDLRLGDGYAMRHPIQDGRLTVIPIVATQTLSAPTYLTLYSGMASHQVTVRELADSQVDTVRIRNKSSLRLVVMAGELIVDAHQDRVIAQDRIIEPHKTALVPVRCVEQGRNAGEPVFHAGNALAELDLRDTVVHKDQAQVWSLVDQINQRLGLTPTTRTYRNAAQSQPAARANAIAAKLAQLPDRASLVGMAVAVDGEVLAIDRFASPELYAAYENELLGSYVASDGGPPHEGRTVIPDDVRAFANDNAQITRTDATFVALRAAGSAPHRAADPWD